MNRRTRLAAGLALMALAPGQPSAAAAEELPIFDTHMHYSREAWAAYGPGRIMDTLDAAGGCPSASAISARPAARCVRRFIRVSLPSLIPLARPPDYAGFRRPAARQNGGARAFCADKTRTAGPQWPVPPGGRGFIGGAGPWRFA